MSFRDRMNDLGWSRREEPVTTQPPNPILGTLSRFNPFGRDGFVQLPTAEGEAPGAPLPARTRREEEEGWFARKSETPSAYKVSAVACAARHRRLPPLRYESWRGGSCDAWYMALKSCCEPCHLLPSSFARMQCRTSLHELAHRTTSHRSFGWEFLRRTPCDCSGMKHAPLTTLAASQSRHLLLDFTP